MIKLRRARQSTWLFRRDVDEAQLGSSGSQFKDASEFLSNEYHFHLTIAVTEIEGEDIENEFNDGLAEIEAMKSFPCS